MFDEVSSLLMMDSSNESGEDMRGGSESSTKEIETSIKTGNNYQTTTSLDNTEVCDLAKWAYNHPMEPQGTLLPNKISLSKDYFLGVTNRDNQISHLENIDYGKRRDPILEVTQVDEETPLSSELCLE